MGFEARPVNLELPRFALRVTRLWGALAYRNAPSGKLTPEASGVRRALGKRRVARDSVDAWIYCGRAVSEAPGATTDAVATYADMTVAQALATDNEGFRSLPERVVRRMQDRQAARHRAARVCCAGSQWAADSIIHDYGVPPTRVRIVGFGRNCEPRPVPRDWSSPRFLFVGKDWKRKNGDAVVRAFVRIRAERPDARLDLVGVHPPLSVEGVTAHGPLALGDPASRHKLEALFESATCLVMPSHYEAFGVAYVEAAAAGVPSIGTIRGGAATAIGEGGVLVDPDSDEELVAAMRRLAEPEHAASTGRAALLRAGEFTWPVIAARVVSLLRGRDAAVSVDG